MKLDMRFALDMLPDGNEIYIISKPDRVISNQCTLIYRTSESEYID